MDHRDKRMIAIDAMEERIIDALGPLEALNAVLLAMSYDDKKEVFEYIMRVYDLNFSEEEDV